MRIVHPRQVASQDVRRRIERLDAFPLRPATARWALGELPDDLVEPVPHLSETARGKSPIDLDPGWVLACSRTPRPGSDLVTIAETPWWGPCSREVQDALGRLWRHSVAVSLAARRLAREANDPAPEQVAHAGLLQGLGHWIIAAIDPEALVRVLALSDPFERRELERREFGAAASTLGRDLAERWGCDPLIADAAWLCGETDRGLEQAGADPSRLLLIQQGYRLAERTPWSLAGGDSREPGSHDPRIKLLTAEVQSRCGWPFLDADATPREEHLTRSNARLRLKVLDLAAGQAARDRFLSALVESDPTDSPETWAARAGLAWCGEPGVSTATVVWGDPPAAAPARPSTLEIPVQARGRDVATVRLWSEADAHLAPSDFATILPAWQAWGAIVADRARLAERLAEIHQAYRQLTGTEEPTLRRAKLDALAEFAAGAGHELNNPLAVIVGRAQLLLVHETDPKSLRSLRAILNQAQRAHRILRDLMYVARPPEPRPRFCQPDEILRASLRDARPDADDREVRLTGDSFEHAQRVWADPDALRHLADMLIRNAMESTPKGGQVRVSTHGDGRSLRWTIHDSGRGINPVEAGHLFDPFYCGRQAGRGLGMGLPRASRFVTQSGGEIRWQSSPGQGSTFHVQLPLADPPKPLLTPAEADPVVVPTTGARPASA